jgi:hypothetical protein
VVPSIVTAPIEGGLGIGRDRAAGGSHQRLAEIFLPLGAFAQQALGVLPRADGLFVLAEPHVNRCENLPGGTVVRPAPEMRLDLCHHVVDSVGRNAARRRRRRQFGRSYHQIDPAGQRGQQHCRGHQRRKPAAPRRLVVRPGHVS